MSRHFDVVPAGGIGRGLARKRTDTVARHHTERGRHIRRGTEKCAGADCAAAGLVRPLIFYIRKGELLC